MTASEAESAAANAAARTRPPSAAQLVAEVAVAGLTRTPAPPEHSVTISRNARGVVQFEVTVRGFDVDGVLGEAVTSFGVLDVKFPYPDANGGTE